MKRPCMACDGFRKIRVDGPGIPTFVDCGACLIDLADRGMQAKQRIIAADAELRAHAQERFGRSGR